MTNNNQRPWYRAPIIIIPAIAVIIAAIIGGIFVIISSPQTPTTPVFRATIGEIDTDGSYEISWKESRRATHYILLEDMDPSFTNTRTIDTKSETRGQIYAKPSGDYYYRVRACNDAGESEWSPILKITVIISTPLPPPPTPTPTPTPTLPPTSTPPVTLTSTLPPTNNPPAAFVDSINPNPARQEQFVTFTCHGDDPDTGDYITEYRWESSIDGFLSNQKTFSISSLSLGSHQIILRVKDSHGQWSSEITRNLEVKIDLYDLDSFENYLSSAEIRDIWVEYDVWEDYSYGMNIYVSFDIYNLKGEDCTASAYFYFENGEPLWDLNQQYYTTDGKVSSGIDFEPSDVQSVFTDLCIFLPYYELHMAPGEYDLKFSVTIGYENTELDRSDWVYFTFTQPY